MGVFYYATIDNYSVHLERNQTVRATEKVIRTYSSSLRLKRRNKVISRKKDQIKDKT